MHSKFWAAAVRKRADELTEPWNWACTRNAPSFLDDASLGWDPAPRARESMMGMNTPPARAVVDGMAGARTASAAARP